MTDASRYYELNRYLAKDSDRKMFCREYKPAPVDRCLRRRDGALPDWPINARFTLKGTGVEDVPFSVVGWYLFSQKLKTLIEQSELLGVEFYPVQVISEVPERLPKYWYAHFAQVGDALDMDRSTYSYFEIKSLDEPVLNLVKPVLIASVVSGLDLFRLREKPGGVFCSAKFRDLFIDNECTGLTFDKIRTS